MNKMLSLTAEVERALKEDLRPVQPSQIVDDGLSLVGDMRRLLCPDDFRSANEIGAAGAKGYVKRMLSRWGDMGNWSTPQLLTFSREYLQLQAMTGEITEEEAQRWVRRYSINRSADL